MNLGEFSKTIAKQFRERAIREPYSTRNQLFAAAWGRLSEAFDGKRKNMWCGLGAPLEFIALFDLVPVPIEMLTGMMAMMGPIDETLDIGSAHLESRDICTYLRTCIGGIETDLFPPPDALLRYSRGCAVAEKVFHVARDKYKVPYFLIDTCRPYVPNATEYCARQLEDTFNQLENLLGVKVTDSKIREVFDNASKTYANMGEIAELMKHMPTPVRSGYIEGLGGLLPFIWGSMESVQITQNYVNEIKENINTKAFPITDEKYRVFRRGNFPWYPNPVSKWLGQEKKVAIVVGANFRHPFGINWQEYPLDSANPFMSMAKQGINTVELREDALESAGILEQGEDLFQSIKDYQIDGIILNSSWGCRIVPGSIPSVINYLARRGVPCVEIQSDPLDRNNFDFTQIQRKIELFLSLIDQHKRLQDKASSTF